MPSFDIVSEIDQHELTNAVDQANREIGNRFDFRGTDARVEQSDKVLTIHADSDFQLEQVLDILRLKLVKRGIEVSCLEVKDSVGNGKMRKQDVIIREGIDKDLSRKIVKMIKDGKAKVQSAVQGESVRVTGKKRDDLQGVM
ncbi:MAG: YajQ family cyclic di-GMP-binding protein, partial [Gammaproteobacteria bacterium]